MRQAVLAVALPLRPVVARAADWLALGKVRLLLLVLFVVAVAAVLAPWGPPSWGVLGLTLLGTALVAGSASAANQCLEVRQDALMPRTASRPLVRGTLSLPVVWCVSLASVALGVALLAWGASPTAALLALASWIAYVVCYTPLKRRSSLNTAVGAVAGALPALIGWAATSPLDLRAWTLFTIVYLWQFPHFMAIAWLYRRQYAQAGMKMLTVVEPSGRAAGLQALLAAGVLVPVSLLPVGFYPLGALYAWGAVALGSFQAVLAWRFALNRTEATARRLLHASLVYLPGLLVLLLLGPVG